MPIPQRRHLAFLAAFLAAVCTAAAPYVIDVDPEGASLQTFPGGANVASLPTTLEISINNTRPTKYEITKVKKLTSSLLTPWQPSSANAIDPILDWEAILAGLPPEQWYGKFDVTFKPIGGGNGGGGGGGSAKELTITALVSGDSDGELLIRPTDDVVCKNTSPVPFYAWVERADGSEEPAPCDWQVYRENTTTPSFASGANTATYPVPVAGTLLPDQDPDTAPDTGIYDVVATLVNCPGIDRPSVTATLEVIDLHEIEVNNQSTAPFQVCADGSLSLTANSTGSDFPAGLPTWTSSPAGVTFAETAPGTVEATFPNTLAGQTITITADACGTQKTIEVIVSGATWTCNPALTVNTLSILPPGSTTTTVYESQCPGQPTMFIPTLTGSYSVTEELICGHDGSVLATNTVTFTPDPAFSFWAGYLPGDIPTAPSTHGHFEVTSYWVWLDADSTLNACFSLALEQAEGTLQLEADAAECWTCPPLPAVTATTVDQTITIADPVSTAATDYFTIPADSTGTATDPSGTTTETVNFTWTGLRWQAAAPPATYAVGDIGLQSYVAIATVTSTPTGSSTCDDSADVVIGTLNHTVVTNWTCPPSPSPALAATIDVLPGDAIDPDATTYLALPATTVDVATDPGGATANVTFTWTNLAWQGAGPPASFTAADTGMQTYPVEATLTITADTPTGCEQVVTVVVGNVTFNVQGWTCPTPVVTVVPLGPIAIQVGDVIDPVSTYASLPATSTGTATEPGGTTDTVTFTWSALAWESTGPPSSFTMSELGSQSYNVVATVTSSTTGPSGCDDVTQEVVATVTFDVQTNWTCPSTPSVSVNNAITVLTGDAIGGVGTYASLPATSTDTATSPSGGSETVTFTWTNLTWGASAPPASFAANGTYTFPVEATVTATATGTTGCDTVQTVVIGDVTFTVNSWTCPPIPAPVAGAAAPTIQVGDAIPAASSFFAAPAASTANATEPGGGVDAVNFTWSAPSWNPAPPASFTMAQLGAQTFDIVATVTGAAGPSGCNSVTVRTLGTVTFDVKTNWNCPSIPVASPAPETIITITAGDPVSGVGSYASLPATSTDTASGPAGGVETVTFTWSDLAWEGSGPPSSFTNDDVDGSNTYNVTAKVTAVSTGTTGCDTVETVVIAVIRFEVESSWTCPELPSSTTEWNETITVGDAIGAVGDYATLPATSTDTATDTSGATDTVTFTWTNLKWDIAPPATFAVAQVGTQTYTVLATVTASSATDATCDDSAEVAIGTVTFEVLTNWTCPSEPSVATATPSATATAGTPFDNAVATHFTLPSTSTDTATDPSGATSTVTFNWSDLRWESTGPKADYAAEDAGNETHAAVATVTWNDPTSGCSGSVDVTIGTLDLTIDADWECPELPEVDPIPTIEVGIGSGQTVKPAADYVNLPAESTANAEAGDGTTDEITFTWTDADWEGTPPPANFTLADAGNANEFFVEATVTASTDGYSECDDSAVKQIAKVKFVVVDCPELEEAVTFGGYSIALPADLANITTENAGTHCKYTFKSNFDVTVKGEVVTVPVVVIVNRESDGTLLGGSIALDSDEDAPTFNLGMILFTVDSLSATADATGQFVAGGEATFSVLTADIGPVSVGVVEQVSLNGVAGTLKLEVAGGTLSSFSIVSLSGNGTAEVGPIDLALTLAANGDKAEVTIDTTCAAGAACESASVELGPLKDIKLTSLAAAGTFDLFEATPSLVAATITGTVTGNVDFNGDTVATIDGALNYDSTAAAPSLVVDISADVTAPTKELTIAGATLKIPAQADFLTAKFDFSTDYEPISDVAFNGTATLSAFGQDDIINLTVTGDDETLTLEVSGAVSANIPEKFGPLHTVEIDNFEGTLTYDYATTLDVSDLKASGTALLGTNAEIDVTLDLDGDTVSLSVEDTDVFEITDFGPFSGIELRSFDINGTIGWQDISIADFSFSATPTGVLEFGTVAAAVSGNVSISVGASSLSGNINFALIPTPTSAFVSGREYKVQSLTAGVAIDLNGADLVQSATINGTAFMELLGTADALKLTLSYDAPNIKIAVAQNVTPLTGELGIVKNIEISGFAGAIEYKTASPTAIDFDGFGSGLEGSAKIADYGVKLAYSDTEPAGSPISAIKVTINAEDEALDDSFDFGPFEGVKLKEFEVTGLIGLNTGSLVPTNLTLNAKAEGKVKFGDKEIADLTGTIEYNDITNAEFTLDADLAAAGVTVEVAPVKLDFQNEMGDAKIAKIKLNIEEEGEAMFTIVHVQGVAHASFFDQDDILKLDFSYADATKTFTLEIDTITPLKFPDQFAPLRDVEIADFDGTLTYKITEAGAAAPDPDAGWSAEEFDGGTGSGRIGGTTADPAIQLKLEIEDGIAKVSATLEDDYEFFGAPDPFSNVKLKSFSATGDFNIMGAGGVPELVDFEFRAAPTGDVQIGSALITIGGEFVVADNAGLVANIDAELAGPDLVPASINGYTFKIKPGHIATVKLDLSEGAMNEFTIVDFTGTALIDVLDTTEALELSMSWDSANEVIELAVSQVKSPIQGQLGVVRDIKLTGIDGTLKYNVNPEALSFDGFADGIDGSAKIADVILDIDSGGPNTSKVKVTVGAAPGPLPKLGPFENVDFGTLTVVAEFLLNQDAIAIDTTTFKFHAKPVKGTLKVRNEEMVNIDGEIDISGANTTAQFDVTLAADKELEIGRLALKFNGGMSPNPFTAKVKADLDPAPGEKILSLTDLSGQAKATLKGKADKILATADLALADAAVNGAFMAAAGADFETNGFKFTVLGAGGDFTLNLNDNDFTLNAAEVQARVEFEAANNIADGDVTAKVAYDNANGEVELTISESVVRFNPGGNTKVKATVKEATFIGDMAAFTIHTVDVTNANVTIDTAGFDASADITVTDMKLMNGKLETLNVGESDVEVGGFSLHVDSASYDGANKRFTFDGDLDIPPSASANNIDIDVVVDPTGLDIKDLNATLEYGLFRAEIANVTYTSSPAQFAGEIGVDILKPGGGDFLGADIDLKLGQADAGYKYLFVAGAFSVGPVGIPLGQTGLQITGGNAAVGYNTDINGDPSNNTYTLKLGTEIRPVVGAQFFKVTGAGIGFSYKPGSSLVTEITGTAVVDLKKMMEATATATASYTFGDNVFNASLNSSINIPGQTVGSFAKGDFLRVGSANISLVLAQDGANASYGSHDWKGSATLSNAGIFPPNPSKYTASMSGSAWVSGTAGLGDIRGAASGTVDVNFVRAIPTGAHNWDWSGTFGGWGLRVRHGYDADFEAGATADFTSDSNMTLGATVTANATASAEGQTKVPFGDWGPTIHTVSATASVVGNSGSGPARIDYSPALGLRGSGRLKLAMTASFGPGFLWPQNVSFGTQFGVN